MTNDQQLALESIAGRSLTADEVAAIQPHLDSRNDMAIADLLSRGRNKLNSHEVGYGTVMETLSSVGLSGGEFLDALVALGGVNRDVAWAVKLLDRGVLDIGRASTQAQVKSLEQVQGFAEYAAGIDALLALGRAPDPIHYNQVSDALNVAEGRMTL